MNKKYRYGILFTVLAISVLLAGCVEKPVETPGEAAGEIKIGIVAPVTGGASTTGTDMWQAAVLAADEINAKGGVPVNGVTCVFG